MAQVVAYPDVWAGIRPAPAISVYADGRVIGPDGLRWLAPAGVEAVRADLDGTGLFAASRTIDPSPTAPSPFGAGFTTYAVRADVGAGPVTVRTTNIFPSDEGRRLIDEAERLSHPEAWLPATAWLPGWSESRPYSPDRWLLEMAWPDPTRAAASTAAVVPASPDLSAIDWPFGPPDLLGSPEAHRASPGVTVRCAVVPDDAVRRLLASLRAYGIDTSPASDYLWVPVGWSARGATLELGLSPALPDDGPACTRT